MVQTFAVFTDGVPLYYKNHSILLSVFQSFDAKLQYVFIQATHSQFFMVYGFSISPPVLEQNNSLIIIISDTPT